MIIVLFCPKLCPGCLQGEAGRLFLQAQNHLDIIARSGLAATGDGHPAVGVPDQRQKARDARELLQLTDPPILHDGVLTAAPIGTAGAGTVGSACLALTAGGDSTLLLTAAQRAAPTGLVAVTCA